MTEDTQLDLWKLDLGAALPRPVSWPWTGPSTEEAATIPGRIDARIKRERRTSLDAPESTDRREKVVIGSERPQGAARRIDEEAPPPREAEPSVKGVTRDGAIRRAIGERAPISRAPRSKPRPLWP